MRELIHISLGKHSNYAQTHYWNLQDEHLKLQQQQNVMFYELTSGKLLPRQLFIDYQDNFGNFSSCFALEKANLQSAQAQAGWNGQV